MEESKIYKMENDDGEEIDVVPLSDVENLKKQLKEKDEKLLKKGDEEKNFEALRKAKEREEAEKAKVVLDNTELTSRIELIEKEREAERTMSQEDKKKKTKESILHKANGNQELADKIEFFYDRFAGDINTEEAREERIADATLLATRKSDVSTSFNTGISARGSSFVPQPKSDDFADTPEGIETARALGLNFINKK